LNEEGAADDVRIRQTLVKHWGRWVRGKVREQG
jgi:hypothetical protein